GVKWREEKPNFAISKSVAVTEPVVMTVVLTTQISAKRTCLRRGRYNFFNHSATAQSFD
ncbi:hypothetical protein Csa_023940, partial [Cucumis sativus]